ncbi:ABC transporter substrate-binding protein [Dietzia lutea]|uniref:SsuA/THI5-like domain-containing protein n=1 Tax=Dietzia lutea TaxID=546160 RepID=A0A2S1R9X9_9ACTN|nr:ABC transporter substrate-binding protein [Dietzia lutea]AWH93086.1 hypothetical protein A6035_13915 [Dietzia lutea]
MVIKKVAAVGAALTLVLAGCSNDSSDTGESGNGELGTITIAAQPAPGYIPVRLASELGMFRNRGLEVEFLPIVGAGPAISALENGSATVHTNTLTVLATANSEGADLRAFCGDLDLTQGAVFAAPGSDLPVAEPDNWQEAVQAWKGKTIGVTALGGTVQAEFEALFHAAGLPLNSVEYSAVGAGEQAIVALETGIVDLLFSYPFLTQNLEARDFVEILSWQEDPPDPLGTASVNFIAKKEWLDANAEAARTFCDVLTEVEGELSDHPEELSDIVSTEYGVTGDALDLAVAPDGPLANHNTEIDCDVIEGLVRRDIESGVVPAAAPTACDELVWRQ